MTKAKHDHLTVEELEALPYGSVFRANGFYTIMSDTQQINAQTVHDDAYGGVTFIMSAEEFASHPVRYNCKGLEGQVLFLGILDEDGINYDDSFTHYFKDKEYWEESRGFRAVNL